MLQWGNLATYENAHAIAACCLIAVYFACLGTLTTFGPGNCLCSAIVAQMLLAVASMITYEDGKVPTEAWAASGTLLFLSFAEMHLVPAT